VFLGCGLLILIALLLTFWFVAGEIDDLYNAALERELRAEAGVLARALRPGWEQQDAEQLEATIETLAATDTKVFIARTDGTILVDSGGVPAGPLTLLHYPEIRSALATGEGIDTRAGVQRASASRVLALRVDTDSGPPLLIWLARPVWRFHNERQPFGRVATAFVLVGVVVLIALAFAMRYRWTALLRRVTRAARSMATGDLTIRADVLGTDDWARVARALNDTRQRLLAETETIERQRRMLQSLVHQIGEGVVVVGGDGRIVLINPAAAALLDLTRDPEASVEALCGRAVEEVIPQHDLQRMLQEAREAHERTPDRRTVGSGPREARLKVELASGPSHLLARVTELALPDPTVIADAVGWLLVVTDITDLSRAMDMQTDFVANASHELRTPISTIRAAIETLLHMDLAEEAPAATGFLEVVDRQSDRLSAMVSDLLNLSRLESGTATFEPERVHVVRVARALAERFSQVMSDKGLNWQYTEEMGDGGSIMVNVHLLQLVLDNLVDNAIKFTETGGTVSLTARREAEQVSFEVADTGCGIPEADRDRVFERFYQVERARSGPARGTGLGLAIVRHAVSAMRGTVTLESEPGVGTRVTVRVPQPATPAEDTGRESSGA
jgi:two-component system phosphate regulon sensor histidine kinase PhoR